MKQLSKSNYLAAIVALATVIAALMAAVAVLRAGEGFDTVKTVCTPGGYEITQTELKPGESITDFIVSDGGVFVLYDETGLINVYDTDGNFRYGILFHTIKNGKGGFAYRDGILYIRSRGNSIYAFDGSELKELVMVDSEHKEYATTIDGYICAPKSHSAGGFDYTASAKGISRNDGSGYELVTERPAESRTAQALTALVLVCGAALLWCAAQYRVLYGKNVKQDK